MGLLQCIISGVVEMQSRQANMVTQLSDKPKIGALTHHQLNKHQSIVNHLHRVIQFDPFGLQMLRCLDGKHDMEMIIQKMTQLVKDGVFTLTEFDVPITDVEKIRKAVKYNIEVILSKLTDTGILIG